MATDCTRPLSRASSAVLNTKAGAPHQLAAGTKRKRDETREEQCTDRDSWVIIKSEPRAPQHGTQASQTDFRSQRTSPGLDLRLIPRVTISRLQLPLIYLDTTTDAADSYPRLFRGHVKVLDVKRDPKDLGDQVLIAEYAATGQLFAVERVHNDVFALCGLQAWVSVADLQRRPAKARALPAAADATARIEQWWTPVSQPPASRGSEKGASALRSRFAMKPNPEKAARKAVEKCLAVMDEAVEPSLALESVPTTDLALADDASRGELFSAIKTHYLESLYIYRTPLAYFVKGPLSRARGALRRGSPASLRSGELIEFLRAHVMTLTVGNKKYDGTLAELICEVPAGITLDDLESQVTTPIKDRIRKSKKRKHLSKEGLLPGEEDYIVRWWARREASLDYAGQEDTRDVRIKSGLTEQRARETQLQIILILEVLALEAAASYDEPVHVVAVEQAEPKKKRKPLDLQQILDVLIDRLCIWESMNLDAPQAKSSKNPSAGPVKKAKTALNDADSDCLRDFCTEIVVPFYATRLPELYISICQKLGGPTVASPPAMRTPAPKRAAKPGAAVRRAPPKDNKQAVDLSLPNPPAPRRAPGPLVRSATDSQLPALKQELRAVDLTSIPRRRPTLQESRRFSQREVDLTAVSAATEAKLARKAAQQQELQTAIAALRKPNARLAVKDLVDAAEQHQAAQSSKARKKPTKQSQPVRNPFATAVQVTATPKVNRVQSRTTPYALPLPPVPQQRAARAALAAPSTQPATITQTSDLVHPSSSDRGARVPASALKPGAHPFASLADEPPPRALLATPSRKRAKVVPARRPTVSLMDAVPAVVPDSSPPLVTTLPAAEVQGTPARPAFKALGGARLDAPLAELEMATLFQTPVKAPRHVVFAGTERDEQIGGREGDRDDAMARTLVGDTPAKHAVALGGDAPARDASAGRAAAGGPGPDESAEDEGAVGSHASVDASGAGPANGAGDIYAMLGWDDDADELGF